MDAALFQRFHPEEYYRRFVADGVRPDGRGAKELRAAKLQRGSFAAPRGSASLRLGQSAAVAAVRAEVTESAPDQPALGRIVANVELPSLCSQAFRERSRQGGTTTFLTSSLTEILNSPHVFDPTQLSIKDAESAWVLRVDVVCLNYDGNAFDLCLLAALAALEDTALPALQQPKAPARPGAAAPRLLEAPSGAAEADLFAAARQVKLLTRPISVSFAQLPGGLWVADPCAEEENLGASVSLCLVGGRWLVFHRGGGAGADHFLGELMPTARGCVPQLTALLDEAAGGPAAMES